MYNLPVEGGGVLQIDESFLSSYLLVLLKLIPLHKRLQPNLRSVGSYRNDDDDIYHAKIPSVRILKDISSSSTDPRTRHPSTTAAVRLSYY
uniref:Uncharacterized protein n=1 Tax=Lepeophtheirus salmonis TaxID=72036 RepID=A0A0K2V6R0_LEPSM